MFENEMKSNNSIIDVDDDSFHNLLNGYMSSLDQDRQLLLDGIQITKPNKDIKDTLEHHLGLNNDWQKDIVYNKYKEYRGITFQEELLKPPIIPPTLNIDDMQLLIKNIQNDINKLNTIKLAYHDSIITLIKMYDMLDQTYVIPNNFETDNFPQIHYAVDPGKATYSVDCIHNIIPGGSFSIDPDPSIDPNNVLQITKTIADYYTLLNDCTIEYSTYQTQLGRFIDLYDQINNYLEFIQNAIDSNYLQNKNKIIILKYIKYDEVVYYNKIVQEMMRYIDNNETNKGNDIILNGHSIDYYKLIIKNLIALFTILNNIQIWENYDRNSYNPDTPLPAQLFYYTYLLIEEINHPLIKQVLYSFFLFKQIIFEYKQNIPQKIEIFIRLNNFDDYTNIIFIKLPNIDHELYILKDTYLDYKESQKLTYFYTIKMENYKEHATDKISVENVLDMTSTEIIGNYMQLPYILLNKKDLVLITFGYSGIGKTFTLFGDIAQKKLGILQSILKELGYHIEKITYTIFELYGCGFPYKSYWVNKEKIYQKLYNYKIENDSVKWFAHDSYENIIKFITNGDYTSINSDTLFKFNTIVEQIDNIRATFGRIKRTKNNKKSSRGIIVYSFIFTIDNTETKFTIIDLPGQEDIIESYTEIKYNYEDNILYDENCINFTSEMYSYINSDNPHPNIKHARSEVLLKCAFLNPLSIFLDTKITFMFYKFIQTCNLKFNPSTEDISYYVGGDLKRIDATSSLTLPNILTCILDSWTQYNFTEHLKDIKWPETAQIWAIDMFRIIIYNNRFDILEAFYATLFIPNENLVSPSCCHNSILSPFEGYYINENILGILSVILSCNMLPNITKEDNNKEISVIPQQPIYYEQNFYDGNSRGTKYRYYNNRINAELKQNVVYSYDPNDIELKTQLYVYRALLRDTSNKTYKLSMPNDLNDIINKMKDQQGLLIDINRFNLKRIILNDNIYTIPINKIIQFNQDELTDFYNKSLMDLFNTSYNYQAAFCTINPPIESLLSPYLNRKDDTSKSLPEIKIFYVIANRDKNTNDKQLKLLNSVKPFLSVVNKYIVTTKAQIQEVIDKNFIPYFTNYQNNRTIQTDDLISNLNNNNPYGSRYFNIIYIIKLLHYYKLSYVLDKKSNIITGINPIDP